MMNKCIAPRWLSAVVLGAVLFGPVAAIAAKTKPQSAQKYTCVFDATAPFPDGTTGVAEIAVKITGKNNTVVAVNYYTADYVTYLGMYQEINGSVVPMTQDEACQFAFEHYSDRQ